jgi:hypothetical protein
MADTWSLYTHLIPSLIYTAVMNSGLGNGNNPSLANGPPISLRDLNTDASQTRQDTSNREGDTTPLWGITLVRRIAVPLQYCDWTRPFLPH